MLCPRGLAQTIPPSSQWPCETGVTIPIFPREPLTKAGKGLPEITQLVRHGIRTQGLKSQICVLILARVTVPRGQKVGRGPQCPHRASYPVFKGSLAWLASRRLPNPSPGPSRASHASRRGSSLRAHSTPALKCPELGPACQGPQTTCPHFAKRESEGQVQRSQRAPLSPWGGPNSRKKPGVAASTGFAGRPSQCQPQAHPISCVKRRRPPACSVPQFPPPCKTGQPQTTG